MPEKIKNIITGVSNMQVEGDLRLGDENHITYVYENSQYKSFFEEVKIDNVEYQKYLPPVFTPILIENLKKNRILFLGGGYNFNKGGFMKYLAGRLIYSDTELVVKENAGFDLHNLLHTIRNENTHCIFLINRATPESLEYNFDELKKVATSGKHYILISTDSPKEAWHFNDSSSNDVWYDIRTSEAYHNEILVKKIKEDIENIGIQLPTYINLSKLSIRLGTPENIDIFIDILSFQKGEITPNVLENILQTASSNDASGISRWFQNLQNDDKLLALGLTLFSGLSELQFFEAMDILIREGWAGRNHNLKPLDYNDIFPLLNYFKIENGYVRSKYPDQDVKLLASAWKTHRRFLDTAQPVLTRLVIMSVSNYTSNWKLFGNQRHRRIIRQVIRESLTRLGAIDFFSIENILISLAASEFFEVRMVAAEVLADLRSAMGDKWYKVVDDWQSDIEIQNLVSVLRDISENSPDYSENVNKQISLNLIQATIAATLGAVAQNDIPNSLDNRVLEQIKRLARIRNDLVTHSVQHTLRSITARHTRQLADSMKDFFLRYSSFIDPIAAGLADGYNNLDPNAVRDTLFNWLDQINKNPVQRKNYTDFLQEDKILCCIILTFQLIDYQSAFEDGRITIEESYQTLDYLRQFNHQPRVRAYLFQAIVSLIEENLRHPSQETISYISNLDIKERDRLVDSFKRQYLSQRAKLSGGDYRVRIYDQLIYSWEIPATRPKTAVEVLMKEWLSHPDKTISQIATMSFLKFGEIEEQEKDLIEAYIEEQRRLGEIEEAVEEEIPEYQSAIEANAFTQVFSKVASSIIPQEYIVKFNNIAPVLMQTNTVSDAQLSKLLANFNDTGNEHDEIVLQLIYLYNLFKNKDINSENNPFYPGFWANLLIITSSGNLTVTTRDRVIGWAPILIQYHEVNHSDAKMILVSLGSLGNQIERRVMLFRFLHRNKWIWLVFAFVLIILLLR